MSVLVKYFSFGCYYYIWFGLYGFTEMNKTIGPRRIKKILIKKTL